jgi:outer membrane protein with beta-barrel domain
VSRPFCSTVLCTIAALLGVASTPAVAQRLSLSPTIGVYIPTSELIKAANGQEFKQEIGLAVGGRLGLDFSPRFGIVTSVSYVPSDLRFTFNQTETKTDANLLFGTARATLYVIPTTSPVWLNINGGASLIKRGGTAYENAEDKTDIGGVVGTTVGFNLGSFLSFYVAAEDYIYGTTFVDASSLEEKRTQNDVQIAVGFGVPLRR